MTQKCAAANELHIHPPLYSSALVWQCCHSFFNSCI